MRYLAQFLRIVLLLALAGNARAQEAFPLQAEMDNTWLGKYLNVARDTSSTLSFEEVKAGKLDAEFKRATRDVPTYGYTDHRPIWAKFQLSNPTDKAIAIYIVSRYAPIDYLTIYSPEQDGSYSSLTMGDMVKFTDRPVPYRFPLFPILVQPGTHTYYAQLKTSSNNQFPLTVVTQNRFQNHELSETIYLGLIFGACIVMLCYNFFVYLKFKSRAYATYTAYIFSYVLFATNYQGVLQQYLFPNLQNSTFLNYVMAFSIDAIAVTALSFSIEFLDLKEKSKRFYYVLNALRWIMALNILNGFTFKIIATQLTLGGSFILSILMIAAGIRVSLKGYKPANYYTVAWAFLLVGNMMVLLAGSGTLPYNAFTSWGQFTGAAIELVLLSIALGARVAQINKEREDGLKRESALQQEMAKAQEDLAAQREEHIRTLDAQVHEKTRDIRSILASINQGIFTISGDGEKLHIQPEYSKYLASMLERTDIVGEDPIEVVFGQSNLTADVLDQVKNTLLNSVSNDPLNFEVNANLLAHEMVLKRADKSNVYIEVDWTPVVNEDDVVEKVLVTLRDVTQIRKLRERAAQQEEELVITGELTTPQGRKYPKIAKSSGEFIAKTEQALAKGSVDSELGKAVLRFLHTLKGEARVSGFKSLSLAVHELETELAAQKELAAEALSACMESLKKKFEQYRVVYEVKLGNDENSADRIFLPGDVARRFYEALEKARNAGQSLSLDDIHLIQKQLNSALGSDLQTVLEDQVADLGRLARELDKTPPVVVYYGQSVTLHKGLHEKLSQAFGHILRNSMDHGIESKDERIAANKDPMGKISITQSPKGGTLEIEVSDDGKGLNLEKVREKAISRGILTAEAAQNPLTVAECIFASGLSTRDQATMISGRGIGMDAVREIMAECGGSIRIELLASGHLNAGHVAFKFVMSVPLQSESSSVKPGIRVAS